MDSEQAPIDEKVQDETVEADGYYGDDVDDEELDLSFLDEEDGEGGKKSGQEEPAKPEQSK